MKEIKDTADTTHHLEEFQPYLEAVDIPDDQKLAFLELIWLIMVEFVALGFGADATSQAIAAHLADSLKNGPCAQTPDNKLTDAFASSQPRTTPENECEARV